MDSYPFGGGDGDFRLFPDDVSFTDRDGDQVVLRKTIGNRVDFYVNKKMRLSGARMVRNGDTLEVTGTIKKGTPLSFLGFNLEDVVTEGCVPSDAAACDAAMALVE